MGFTIWDWVQKCIFWIKKGKWKKETEKWKKRKWKWKLHLSVNRIVSPEVIPAPTAQAFHTITWSSWKVLKVSMTFRKSSRLLRVHCSQEPLLPDVRARKADFLILFAFLSRVSHLFHFHVSSLCSLCYKSMSLSWFLTFLNLEISPPAIQSPISGIPFPPFPCVYHSYTMRLCTSERCLILFKWVSQQDLTIIKKHLLTLSLFFKFEACFVSHNYLKIHWLSKTFLCKTLMTGLNCLLSQALTGDDVAGSQ